MNIKERVVTDSKGNKLVVGAAVIVTGHDVKRIHGKRATVRRLGLSFQRVYVQVVGEPRMRWIWPDELLTEVGV